MDFLETQLKSTTSKRPEDEVKRLIIQMMLGTLEMAKKIERIKTKEDLSDFVDKVITKPQKPKLFQDVVAISDLVSETKEGLVKIREAERKRQEREAKRAAAVAAGPFAAATTAGSGGPVMIINNYTVMGNQVIANNQTTSQTTNNQIVGSSDGDGHVNPKQQGGGNGKKGKKEKKAPEGRLTIPKSVRGQSWDRWIGSKQGLAPCFCCRINEISKAQFECGHVMPDALGGLPTVENLRPICLPCNRSMGTIDMRQFCRTYYREELDIPYEGFEISDIAAKAVEVKKVKPLKEAKEANVKNMKNAKEANKHHSTPQKNKQTQQPKDQKGDKKEKQQKPPKDDKKRKGD